MINFIPGILLFQIQQNAIEFNTYIVMALLLFSLSLIAERIINLIKLHSPRLRDRSFDQFKEKKREKAIMGIAILTGLFVAILTYADLFYLISNGRLGTLQNNPLTLKSTIGTFLSALIISFGSKFWHDVLDIVLQFSNLRKFKANEKSQQITFKHKELTSIKRAELARKVKSISPRLQALKGYAGYKVTTYENGQTVAQLMFIESAPPSRDREWISSILKDGYEVLIAHKSTKLDT